MGQLYKIAFPNGKEYIGITRYTAKARFAIHVRMAKHRNNAVCHAILKYGSQCTEVTVLAIGNYEYLAEVEPRAIASFGTKAPFGYNMTDGGEGTPNPTEETRAKIGAGHKPGAPRHTQPHTLESRKAMSLAHAGKRLTNEWKARISKALLGNKRNLGKRASDETKQKQRFAHLGKQFTEQHRANIAVAARKREEQKRLIRRGDDGLQCD